MTRLPEQGTLRRLDLGESVSVLGKGEARYWTESDGDVWLADSLPELITGTGDHKLSPGALAAFADRRGGIWLTPFTGVHRLTFGHRLEFAPRGPEVTRWLRPEANLDRRTSLREVAALLREVIEAEVAAALGPDVSASVAMSGGLDSTLVAAIAAEGVSDPNRLTAYCAVPSPPPPPERIPRGRIADEWPLAEAVGEYTGIATVRLANLDRVDWLDSVDSFHARHFRSLPAQSNYWWLAAMEEAAMAAGHRIILTGQSGNATLSGGPPHAAPPLLADGSWAAGGLRARSLDAIRRLRAGAGAGGGGSWPSPVRPGLPVSMPDHVLAMDPWLRWCLADPPTGGRGPWTGADVTWVDPLGTASVITAAMSLPTGVWHRRRRGVDRALARDLAADLLPAAVGGNQLRGQQGTDMPWLLLEHAEHYLAAIDRVCQSPTARTFLDTEALAASGVLLRAGYAEAHVWQQVYLNAIAVGLFADWWDRTE
ncbi:MAG: hypothetical protein QG671_1884 [Actinomycetota bacterium]|nr:hypothetical protein [Actinomycetota bacterium]